MSPETLDALAKWAPVVIAGFGLTWLWFTVERSQPRTSILIGAAAARAPAALPQLPAELPKLRFAVDEQGIKWLRSSPQELKRYFNSLPLGMRQGAADDLVGLQVHWKGKLAGVREEDGEASLQLIADEPSSFREAFFATVPLFAGLKNYAEGTEIAVEGTIHDFMPSLTTFLEPAEVSGGRRGPATLLPTEKPSAIQSGPLTPREISRQVERVPLALKATAAKGFIGGEVSWPIIVKHIRDKRPGFVEVYGEAEEGDGVGVFAEVEATALIALLDSGARLTIRGQLAELSVPIRLSWVVLRPAVVESVESYRGK